MELITGLIKEENLKDSRVILITKEHTFRRIDSGYCEFSSNRNVQPTFFIGATEVVTLKYRLFRTKVRRLFIGENL